MYEARSSALLAGAARRNDCCLNPRFGQVANNAALHRYTPLRSCSASNQNKTIAVGDCVVVRSRDWVEKHVVLARDRDEIPVFSHALLDSHLLGLYST